MSRLRPSSPDCDSAGPGEDGSEVGAAHGKNKAVGLVSLEKKNTHIMYTSYIDNCGCCCLFHPLFQLAKKLSVL